MVKFLEISRRSPSFIPKLAQDRFLGGFKAPEIDDLAQRINP